MKRIILLFLSAVIMTACSEYKKIDVGKVSFSGLDFLNTTTAVVRVSASVDNPTDKIITIDHFQFRLKKSGKDFVHFSLQEVPEVLPHSQENVRIGIRAKAVDPIAILSTGLDIRSWNLDDFTLDGKVSVRIGKMKKTLRFRNRPVNEIIYLFR